MTTITDGTADPGGYDPSNLSGLVQMAARDLPEGWHIELRVEKDAGLVLLKFLDGEYIDFPWVDPTNIEYCFRDALLFAREFHLDYGHLTADTAVDVLLAAGEESCLEYGLFSNVRRIHDLVLEGRITREAVAARKALDSARPPG